MHLHVSSELQEFTDRYGRRRFHALTIALIGVLLILLPLGALAIRYAMYCGTLPLDPHQPLFSHSALGPLSLMFATGASLLVNVLFPPPPPPIPAEAVSYLVVVGTFAPLVNQLAEDARHAVEIWHDDPVTKEYAVDYLRRVTVVMYEIRKHVHRASRILTENVQERRPFTPQMLDEIVIEHQVLNEILRTLGAIKFSP